MCYAFFFTQMMIVALDNKASAASDHIHMVNSVHPNKYDKLSSCIFFQHAKAIMFV